MAASASTNFSAKQSTTLFSDKPRGKENFVPSLSTKSTHLRFTNSGDQRRKATTAGKVSASKIICFFCSYTRASLTSADVSREKYWTQPLGKKTPPRPHGQSCYLIAGICEDYCILSFDSHDFSRHILSQQRHEKLKKKKHPWNSDGSFSLQQSLPPSSNSDDLFYHRVVHLRIAFCPLKR